MALSQEGANANTIILQELITIYKLVISYKIPFLEE